jgi:hypothetical protein
LCGIGLRSSLAQVACTRTKVRDAVDWTCLTRLAVLSIEARQTLLAASTGSICLITATAEITLCGTIGGRDTSLWTQLAVCASGRVVTQSARLAARESGVWLCTANAWRARASTGTGRHGTVSTSNAAVTIGRVGSGAAEGARAGGRRRIVTTSASGTGSGAGSGVGTGGTVLAGSARGRELAGGTKRARSTVEGGTGTATGARARTGSGGQARGARLASTSGIGEFVCIAQRARRGIGQEVGRRTACAQLARRGATTARVCADGAWLARRAIGRVRAGCTSDATVGGEAEGRTRQTLRAAARTGERCSTDGARLAWASRAGELIGQTVGAGALTHSATGTARTWLTRRSAARSRIRADRTWLASRAIGRVVAGDARTASHGRAIVARTSGTVGATARSGSRHTTGGTGLAGATGDRELVGETRSTVAGAGGRRRTAVAVVTAARAVVWRVRTGGAILARRAIGREATGSAWCTGSAGADRGGGGEFRSLGATRARARAVVGNQTRWAVLAQTALHRELVDSAIGTRAGGQW